jgi:Rieske Fe-S protein
MSSQGAHHAYQASSEPKRRDLLSLIATAGAAIGLGAISWPLIDYMNPSADVVAGGAPIDIDLSNPGSRSLGTFGDAGVP